MNECIVDVSKKSVSIENTNLPINDRFGKDMPIFLEL